MIVGLRPGFSPTAPRAPVKLSLERLHAGARCVGGSAPGLHPLEAKASGSHPQEAKASGSHPRQAIVCSPFQPGRSTRSSQSWPLDRRSPFQAHTCVYTILSHSRVGLDMTGDTAALRGSTLQLRPVR